MTKKKLLNKHLSISAFFPCFNDAGTIASMVELATLTLRKLTRDFEVIVIDDGSTDNTEIIINSFRDSRIKVFKTEHQGLPKILNLGISLASNNLFSRKI